ncbi:KAP family P-loop NTPase fold protein [Flexistipes sp.]|uniref:KAP family P-loop NTPase fold protein n=1 Tax=Flexistipes sp. TaxID=3088135 RepID=UPI002E1AD7A5|nr:P-loop NTPase fold protein [Flexistipes sp.]
MDDANLTFESYDKLELKPFAERLEKYIKVEHLFFDESLVISLNASFGSGKTTFLKMWKKRIDKEESCFGNKPTVVKINAWKDDYCGDPFISLVSSLIEEFGVNSKEGNKLKKVIKKISLGMANQAIKKHTGMDISEVLKYPEELALPSPFQVYEQKKNALEEIKEIIKEFISEDKLSIIFFIDELDRCRPDYAISYLETIKHVFDIKGIAFILAVDRNQLECTAKVAFGNDMDFPEYYRKFVQREILLPKPTADANKKLSRELTKYYLQQNHIRNCWRIIEHGMRITELINSLELTPRQTHEALRVLSHYLGTDEGDKSLEEYPAAGIILMSIVRTKKPDIYEKLGKEGIEPTDAKILFNNMIQDSKEWWFKMCLSENCIKINGKSFKDIFVEAGVPDVWEAGDSYLQEEQRLTNHQNQFKRYYSDIEDLLNFEN